MIWLIAEITIRRYLYDLRFVFSAGVIILLFIASGALFAHEMNRRWESYRREEITAWYERNLEQVRLVKPPSPLAFLAEGGERNLSSIFRIEPEHSEPIEMDTTRGPFLELLREIDWVYIVSIFLTLFTLLFSYDLVSGEREAGTLSLVLAQPISRAQVLAGTYVGALLSLTVSMLIAMSGHLLLVLLLSHVSLVSSDATRIGVVIVLSVVFLSIFLLIGLCMSSLSRHASTALVSALMLWVLLILIIPNAAEPVATILDPLPSPREYQQQIRAIERIESQKPHLQVSSDMIEPIVLGPYSQEEKKRRVEALQRQLTEEHLAARWEIRRMQNQVRRERERRKYDHQQLVRWLSRASPFALYEFAAESIADTGFIHQERFRRQIERYTDLFTSFTSPLRKQYAHLAAETGYGLIEVSGYRLKIPSGLDYSRVTVPPQNFPEFRDRQASLRECLAEARGDLSGLVMANLALFFVTLYTFLRYDVRAG